MKRSGIVYRSRVDVGPEAEISTLTNVYRFILDCHAKNKAARPDGTYEKEKGGKRVGHLTSNPLGVED